MRSSAFLKLHFWKRDTKVQRGRERGESNWFVLIFLADLLEGHCFRVLFTTGNGTRRRQWSIRASRWNNLEAKIKDSINHFTAIFFKKMLAGELLISRPHWKIQWRDLHVFSSSTIVFSRRILSSWSSNTSILGYFVSVGSCDAI
jgi:hypothetical protein